MYSACASDSGAVRVCRTHSMRAALHARDVKLWKRFQHDWMVKTPPVTVWMRPDLSFKRACELANVRTDILHGIRKFHHQFSLLYEMEFPFFSIASVSLYFEIPKTVHGNGNDENRRVTVQLTKQKPGFLLKMTGFVRDDSLCEVWCLPRIAEVLKVLASNDFVVRTNILETLDRFKTELRRHFTWSVNVYDSTRFNMILDSTTRSDTALHVDVVYDP